MENKLAQGYCDKDCKRITDGQSRGDDYQCGVCKKYTAKNKQGNPEVASEKFDDNGYTAQYVVSSEKRITSIEEVEALCKFDKNVWQIDRWQQEAGVSEGYRKDRKVDWEVKDGKVTQGKVEDSGKMLVVPLHTFKVRVWLSRKTDEIRNRSIVSTFIEEAQKHSPKYPKLKYQKSKDGVLLELALPDMQLGRVVSAYETGIELNPELQIERATSVVDRLIENAKHYKVSRILFPVGNDFFDANNSGMSTAHGTPMTDDSRWHRTFSLGCKFLVDTIDKLQTIAPVDVLVIPGNHDEESMWHAGEYLSAWYNKNPQVFVDNRPQKRKYYTFEKVLLMLTHGYSEKMNQLASLMAFEVPQLWAQSNFREVHLGDKHHKVDMILKTKELENGVIVRILRSLAVPSVWEFDKGLVGSLKAGELFVWHPTNGLKAQFTENI